MTSLASPAVVLDAFHAGLRPDPLQTLSEWSDANMILTNVAEKGPYRTDRTPYAREIMDCLSPSHPCQEVVLIKAHQMCGTQIIVNFVGYVIDRFPANIMLVEPKIDLAKRLSKQKVQKMLNVVPCLRGKVRESRSRDSGNTILVKEYVGGACVFAGANSGTSLRFQDAQYVLMDEVDAYPEDVDGEGHPTELAKNRTSTFVRCKIYKVSTPLIKGSSIIERDYLKGSRGRYHVPCPFCGHYQWLRWREKDAQDTWINRMIFIRDEAGKLKDARYQCEQCHELIPEFHKTEMLAKGKWVHEDPDNPIRSFHINILYQPYGWKLNWLVLAKEWVDACREESRGDTRKLQNIVNTYFGETWEEKSEHFEQDELMDRKERYAATVPSGVLVLTGAVDVQDDRLEVECVGWGVGEECWSIDYQRFMGSPAREEVWEHLDRWLLSTFEHEDSIPMKMRIVCVDTGGHHTQDTYKFVRRRQHHGLRAIKGSSTPGMRGVTRGSKDKLTGVWLYLVGTDTFKDTIFANFKIKEPGPGYCHWPDLPNYDHEYFDQITSEEKREKKVRGIVMGHEYVKKRGVRRNEALDLRVYNHAALSLTNLDLKTVAESWAVRVAKQKALLADPASVQRPSRQIVRSKFMEG